MNILLIGFGNVAQGLLTILHEKGEALRQCYGFDPRIVSVATRSQGNVYDRDGFAPKSLLTSGLSQHADKALDIFEMIRQPEVDVVIETTPSDYLTGQPALDYSYATLEAGKHLVLANKVPVVVDYAGLQHRADTAGRGFYFEATVMSGTPSLRLAREALAGCTISRVRGILNGTTNYILTQMELGMTYADALSLAQQQGYAEADPTADVEGWDAAGKLIILASALFGTRLRLDEMKVVGISGITPTNVQKALANGERWKLIAEATMTGGSVRPVLLPITDPLASVSGATNAITYATDLLGDVTLIGAGAGRTQTGFALLSDLLAIHQRFYS